MVKIEPVCINCTNYKQATLLVIYNSFTQSLPLSSTMHNLIYQASPIPVPGQLNTQGVPLPYVQNISCIFPPTPELGGLYLGNFFGAQDVTVLKEYGIRAVLTTSVQTPIYYAPQDIPFYKRLDAHDKQNFSIIEHLEDLVEFIDEHRAITNVYVHCYAGMSRSASAVIAYLMKKMSWNYDHAFRFLKYKRVIVNPNEGFVKQLRQFQQQLFNKSAPKPFSPKPQKREVSNLDKSTVSSQLKKSSVAGIAQERHAVIALKNNNNISNLNEEARTSRADKSIVPKDKSGPEVGSRPTSPIPRSHSTQLVRRQNIGSNNQQTGYLHQSPFFPQAPQQMIPNYPQVGMYSIYNNHTYRQKPAVAGFHSIQIQQAPKKSLHQDIPIPKFGNKKSGQESKGSAENYSANDKSVLRASKAPGAIRPRDLPGYRAN